YRARRGARERCCGHRTQPAHKTPLSYAHSGPLWLKAGGNWAKRKLRPPPGGAGIRAQCFRVLIWIGRTVRYIVLRITKRPTPTTGPNNVATTIMTNDLPTITQPRTYALNSPTKDAPTHPSSNSRAEMPRL